MAQTESAAGKSLKVSLDSMTEHDLLEVVEIEAICGLSPWGWDSYHRELDSGREAVMLVARIDVPQPSLADGMRIAGFVVSRVIAGELHINNIAVRPEFQKMGIGSRLLNRALLAGSKQNCLATFLEVRASNRAAQKLYEHCGFNLAGRRKRYYANPPEDALIMSKNLRPKP